MTARSNISLTVTAKTRKTFPKKVIQSTTVMFVTLSGRSALSLAKDVVYGVTNMTVKMSPISILKTLKVTKTPTFLLRSEFLKTKI